MKLLIAVPCLEKLDVEFVRSMNALIRRLDRENVDYEIKYEVGALVYIARDVLAQYAVKNYFTHVLWLDSDMIFADDVFDKLLSTNAEFATGVCRSRHGLYRYCIFETEHKYVEKLPDKPFEVFMCGLACVLMKTSVLQHIAEKNNGHCFVPTQYFGEDLQFCTRAQAMGYRIICHPDVKVGHLAKVEVWPDDVEDLKAYTLKEHGVS